MIKNVKNSIQLGYRFDDFIKAQKYNNLKKITILIVTAVENAIYREIQCNILFRIVQNSPWTTHTRTLEFKSLLRCSSIDTVFKL